MDMTVNEQTHLASLREIEDCGEISVESSTQEPLGQDSSDVDDLAEIMPDLNGVIFSETLRRCALRFAHLACHWRHDDPNIFLGGEFWVPAFFDGLFEPHPAIAWQGSSEDEKQLYREFRTIDDTPNSGSGTLAAVRLQAGKDPLEIWYYDPQVGPTMMDVDYCGYLAALLVTKGTYGWQYLFADVSLADDIHHHTVENARRMLEVFPRLFPGYDYAPLAARLEARL